MYALGYYFLSPSLGTGTGRKVIRNKINQCPSIRRINPQEDEIIRNINLSREAHLLGGEQNTQTAIDENHKNLDGHELENPWEWELY